MSARLPFTGGLSLTWLFAIILAFCLLDTAYGFGAGNIPSFSFLEGKAFRHGDLEDTLAELVKRSGGILGRGSKFGGLDIKRVYFGNWLRDYSQAMDVAGLTKLSKQTIINLCIGLGFLAHGYATGEFEVTDERLGVYLCTEHLDNPKGYGVDAPGGDARNVDPRLRPPVDPRELEIDPRTGMKNYLANENGTWDTSSRLIRERINQCITIGRRGRNGGGENDLYEAYRLLGTLLHSLEDFSAHSNWVELSLRRLGYSNVFCHVGDAVIIQTPAGPAPPLVTGTFGGADFLHSLLGEATDHISEASVSDLAKAMDGAKSRSMDGGASDTLRDMLFNLPGGGGTELTREMNNIEDIRTRAQNGDPTQMSPQELHATMWQVLVFRDNVVKTIEKTIERIPGLSSIVEKLTDAINRFVFTTLEPLLKPIMGQATKVLGEGSTAVLKSEDQMAVFNDPHASDPTHSFLSKDHFGLILNEPAGKVACVVVSHTVRAIVNAWEHDNVDPNQVATQVLEALHHPFFFNDQSAVQRDMGTALKQWIDSNPDKSYILDSLTKQSVRTHKNMRKGHVADQIGHGCGGEYNSILSPEKVSAFASAHVPGASNVIGGYNKISNQFASAQQFMGGRREGDDENVGIYMPPPGAPPLEHGQRPPIPTNPDSFSGPSFNPDMQMGGGGGYNPGYGQYGGGDHPGPSYGGPPPPGMSPGPWGQQQQGGPPPQGWNYQQPPPQGGYGQQGYYQPQQYPPSGGY